MCTHCSFWSFVFVKYFSSNIFLLGHKGCRLVHSIPNLLNSSVSWVYISLCAEQVPAHKQDSEEQHTHVGAYLPCPPLPVSCSANTANTFLFCLCNQHRKILCVCSLPHSLSLPPEGYCDHKLSVHTGSNAFWALCSNVEIRKRGWVLQLTAVSLWNWGNLCSNTTLASLGENSLLIPCCLSLDE